jgi:redox-sensitive bicupin YhaK (pirin superfamily)
MGNRGTFSSPGIQWISAGSGIEHAEAGGTPAGENMTGFQIWGVLHIIVSVQVILHSYSYFSIQ